MTFGGQNPNPQHPGLSGKPKTPGIERRARGSGIALAEAIGTELPDADLARALVLLCVADSSERSGPRPKPRRDV